ncbi:MAG: 4a-hydroxytetrahydrobiopterin dehydratase [bacterium]|nr:4a-hydroxytetrahydrobiopterin dehydratase [bacterium]
MNDLIKKHCIPCEGGVSPLDEIEIKEYLKQVPEWSFIKSPHHSIDREFKFRNFIEAMEFVNKVADLAEREGHHPDITINYNKVNLSLWTHAIGGLFENDFILAAKIDKL